MNMNPPHTGGFSFTNPFTKFITNSKSETIDKNKIAKNSSSIGNKDKEEVNTLYREEKEVIPIYNKEPI